MVLSQLLTNDIIDSRILQAMKDIPREPFVPESLRGVAYVDEDLEIAPGRYLLAPLTFAMLLDLTKITPSSRVLVVGCLTGYPAAIVSRLAGQVVAIDTDEATILQARDHVKRLGISHAHPHKVASLAEGYAQSAPYDAIVVCGAIEFIPEVLGAQLAEGGRLVTIRNVATRPDSQGGLGKGLLVEKFGRRLQYREHFDASSAVLPGFERRTAFVF